jgi:hypothetical protein
VKNTLAIDCGPDSAASSSEADETQMPFGRLPEIADVQASEHGCVKCEGAGFVAISYRPLGVTDAENADVGRVHDADGELGNSGGIVGEVPRCVLVMTPEVRAWLNTAYFRRFDFSGVLLPLCSVSFFESVF